ncbi:MAG TPA: aminotransferase class V-fold PLP-dependent enzyme [Methanosarcina sp.]
MELLQCNVFGNPHSENPTSMAMTKLVERARNKILSFFNASPDEYVVIFTPNATGALRLVGEAYPFEAGGQFLLTVDNHNSVNGIRVFAESKGASVSYIPVEPSELRVDEEKLDIYLGKAKLQGNNLFAYPAQSNFSGVQHPLDWIEKARKKGWDVLLDCAAFVPTNRLDLSQWHPDFVSISFYKIFGYPTGLGCLLARKVALNKLKRPWFSGGTISIVSVQKDNWYCLQQGDEAFEAFEDGTINYLSVPALEIGLKYIERIGVDTIHKRVMCLTGWLLDNMQALRYPNGQTLVKIHGPSDLERRGGTIAFNLYHADRTPFDCQLVQDAANKARISLRTGCFCNPGDGEVSHNITRNEMASCFENLKPSSRYPYGSDCKDHESCLAVKTKMASIRVSLGLVTNFSDVYLFMNFLHGLMCEPKVQVSKAEKVKRRVFLNRGP